jgi:hypothetical protein
VAREGAAPPAADARSPCVNLCALDPATGWCIGCGRTGAEIGAWPVASAVERVAITGRLAARLQRLAGKS